MNRFVPYELGAPKSVCSESVMDGSISAAFIIFPDAHLIAERRLTAELCCSGGG